MLSRRAFIAFFAMLWSASADAMRMRGSGVVATQNVIDSTSTLVVDDTGQQVTSL